MDFTGKLVAQVLLLVSGVSAAARYRGGPVNTTRVCGTTDTVPSGDYTLLNNLWGIGNINPTPVGFQCSNIDFRDNSSIAWTANFQWGPNQGGVKGYTNMQQNKNVGLPLTKIASMPTIWQYTLTTPVYSDLTYNVAYDTFTSASPDLLAPATNEIMVWTNVHYMTPVTNKDANGNILYLAQNVQLAGYTWTVYVGSRGVPVYTFVLNSGTPNFRFQADLMLFYNWLIARNLIKSTDYLNVVQAGTEVIKAGTNTTLKTSYYNIDINPVTTTTPPLNSQLCGLTDSKTIPSGMYTLNNNLWGVTANYNGNPGLGSQCSNVNSLPDANSIAWEVDYAWYNGSLVKGYANVALNTGAGTQLSKISSLPSSWSYTFGTTGKYYNSNYDVAYTFGLGSASNPGSTAGQTTVVMVWPSFQYMVPVTDRDPTTKKPLYLAQGLKLSTSGSYTWTVYGGTLGSTKYYAFVNEAPGTSVTFTEDMAVFFKYLIARGLVSASSYLNVLQAGSEIITTDPAALKTSYYSLQVVPGTLTVPPLSSSSSSIASSTSKTSSTIRSTSTVKSTSTTKKATSSTKKATSTTKKTSSTKTSSSKKPTSTVTFPQNWALKYACVSDKPDPNRLMTFKIIQNDLTPTTCAAYCNSNKYLYAGVQYGKECWCSNTLNTKGGAGAVSTACNVKCAGDATKNCGGQYAFEVFAKVS